MACSHKWFTGFYGCICEVCDICITFDSFIKKYSKKDLFTVRRKTAKDYEGWLREYPNG